MNKQLRTYIPRVLALLAVVGAFETGALSTTAQGVSGDFTFKIDQHQNVLDDQATLANIEADIAEGILNPNDSSTQKALMMAQMAVMMSDMTAMWTIPSQATMMRMHPGVAIKNSSASTLNIVGFEISIGSNANLYRFDNHYMNNLPAMPSILPAGVALSALLEDNANSLVVTFGNNGILPGYMATMQIQLGLDNPAPNAMFPQLQEFFSVGSTLTVTYKDPLTGNLFTTDPQLPFGEFDTFTSEIQNQIMTAGPHIMTVESYEIGGSVVGVPEPSSLVLAFASLASYLLLGRRQAA